MATQPSFLSCRTPWTEEPGRLQSMMSQRTGHDLSSWAHRKVIWHLQKLMIHVKVKLLSHVWLFATTWTVTDQATPSIRFSRQEYWSGLPFLSSGDLPNPEIESGSPAFQADTLLSELLGKPYYQSYLHTVQNSVFKQRRGLVWKWTTGIKGMHG